ncbi:MAG: amidohydrolase family protein [Gammaproteobacteria bacterium]|nr:dihydroorotase [Gammaproteobacteria bacterium]
MKFDLAIVNGTVVFPESGLSEVDIAVKDGRIAAILQRGIAQSLAAQTLDASGKYVFPGLIDAHIHFGFAEPVTEYTTETIYAAQGGFSTVIGYFLNNEDYGGVFEREIQHATPRAHVDFAFHFSTASEDHIRGLESYVRKYGVRSFKYFMNFKGEEGRYLGLDGTDDGYLYALLQEAARIGNVTVVLHTENIELVNRIRREMQAGGKSTLRDWSLSKPPFTEAENVVRAMYFAEHHGATIYIPHLSSRMALDEVRRWRERYNRIYVETCPHYLTHTMDADIGSIGKANPPFRAQEDVDALWEGLADGTIDVVASDHVPRKRATKEKGIWQASQGFPGTATILPVLMHEGYHRGRLSIQRIAQLLTSAPAKIFALDSKKGDLRVGMDADITIVDPNLEREVRPEELGSYSDYSLYEGQKLKGWPSMTIVRGVPVMQDGKIVGPAGHGKYLPRY